MDIGNCFVLIIENDDVYIFFSCPSHICCRFFKLRPWNDEISDCAMLWVYINWYISMLLCLKISILDLIGSTTTIRFSLVLERFRLLINGTPGLVWDRGVNLNGSNIIRHLLNINTMQINLANNTLSAIVLDKRNHNKNSLSYICECMI